MDPIAYILISVFAVPFLFGVFWSGKKLGVIETKVKNTEGDVKDIKEDIIGIKKDVKAIRNGK